MALDQSVEPAVRVDRVALVAHRVPVAHLVLAVSRVGLVLPVPASRAQVAVPLVVPLALLRVDSLVLAVALVVAVVVELAVEPPVPSVRAEPAARARPASRSVPSAKSSNSAAMHHRSVVLLFHAETVRPLFACVVARQSKTLQTRSTPMQVS